LIFLSLQAQGKHTDVLDPPIRAGSRAAHVLFIPKNRRVAVSDRYRIGDYYYIFDVSLIALERATQKGRKYARPPHKVGKAMHWILPHIFMMPDGRDKGQIPISSLTQRQPLKIYIFSFSENKFRA
jgi:hypothetical protein